MPIPAAEPGVGRPPGRLAAWLFGAVTVVPAMLAAAWLLPAFPLLLAVSYLGKSSRPTWGAGVLAVARRPLLSESGEGA